MYKKLWGFKVFIEIFLSLLCEISILCIIDIFNYNFRNNRKKEEQSNNKLNKSTISDNFKPQPLIEKDRNKVFNCDHYSIEAYNMLRIIKLLMNVIYFILSLCN